MKTKQITAYFCDHCNKLYRRKHFAIRHEERCNKNPINQRPCFSCQFLTMKEHSYLVDNGHWEYEEKRDLFFCSKKEHFIYPPISDYKGNYIETDEPHNEPMPKYCGYPLIDLAKALKINNVITLQEFDNFKQTALPMPELATEILNGFNQRPKPESFLPF